MLQSLKKERQDTTKEEAPTDTVKEKVRKEAAEKTIPAETVKTPGTTFAAKEQEKRQGLKSSSRYCSDCRKRCGKKYIISVGDCRWQSRVAKDNTEEWKKSTWDDVKAERSRKTSQRMNDSLICSVLIAGLE